MQKVEGSNPFIRSIEPVIRATWPSGLGTGLQNPLHRFNSGRRLLRDAMPPLTAPRGGVRGEALLFGSGQESRAECALVDRALPWQAGVDPQTWKTLLERDKVLRAKRGESRFVGEEKCEQNGNRRRRYQVLTLAIVLPVVLVILPGFLLILGLGRAAGKERPRPAGTSAMVDPLGSDPSTFNCSYFVPATPRFEGSRKRI